MEHYYKNYLISNLTKFCFYFYFPVSKPRLKSLQHLVKGNFLPPFPCKKMALVTSTISLSGAKCIFMEMKRLGNIKSMHKTGVPLQMSQDCRFL